MRNIKTLIDSPWIYLGVGFFALFGGIRGCDMALNNRNITTLAHKTHSYATGLTGHVEYTKYADGSREVVNFPSFGSRFFDVESHQDLDGDGDVDRIRRIGSELKMNRLSGLIVREQDYDSNKERFDEADSQLSSLIKEYD